MKEQEKPKIKMFLDIPNAAELTGFSIRQFQRIIEEDHVPIFQIKKKFFILGRDFELWKQSKKPRHLETLKKLRKSRRPRLY
ncbi:MAG: hypothetical protein G01um101444_90 [Parcubacteria group bacterium Gr01-1014_44]|nr:MAG: hypothetical protein G01um101444_90 [Parcubacteria group bacterium Gr01-1014_44]